MNLGTSRALPNLNIPRRNFGCDSFLVSLELKNFKIIHVFQIQFQDKDGELVFLVAGGDTLASASKYTHFLYLVFLYSVNYLIKLVKYVCSNVRLEKMSNSKVKGFQLIFFGIILASIILRSENYIFIKLLESAEIFKPSVGQWTMIGNLTYQR